MDRRFFIKSVGVLAGTASSISAVSLATAATPGPVQLSPAQIKQIESSIRASFGSGFRLVSTTAAQGETQSVIENRGNVYEVASTDGFAWKITNATDM